MTRHLGSTVRALLAALVLLGAIMVPTVGSSAHGQFCRGEFSQGDPQSRSCNVNFYGFPLTLYADACSADCRTGTVNVSASISLNNGTVPLVACIGSGVGFASCSAEISFGEAVSSIIGTAPLACYVNGGRSGIIQCATGCQGPTSGIECQILATVLPTPS